MQNSGQGNTINPLASLADRDVYAVPMLLLIGWRGQGDSEPNHPQHKLQGEITPGLLELMHIPCDVLTDMTTSSRQLSRKQSGTAKRPASPMA